MTRVQDYGWSASYWGTEFFLWTIQLLFQLPHTVIKSWRLPPFLEFLDQCNHQMLFNFFGFVRHFIIALFQLVNSAWSGTGRKKATIFFQDNIWESRRSRSFLFDKYSGNAIFDWLPCLQLVYVQINWMRSGYLHLLLVMYVDNDT